MRILLCFLAILWCPSASAEKVDRTFLCDAIDRFDRESKIEINIDTKDIQMFVPAGWKTVYSGEIACGVKTKPGRCVREVLHNLNDPNRPYDALTFSARCYKGNTPILEQNGNMEINRMGDGKGKFVCGRQSFLDLALRNCTLP